MNHSYHHSCKPLKSFASSEALKITVEKENSEWYLFYKTYATEYDVKSGEAECIGAKIGEVNIAIQYCPFCGQALGNDEDMNGQNARLKDG